MIDPSIYPVPILFFTGALLFFFTLTVCAFVYDINGMTLKCWSTVKIYLSQYLDYVTLFL